MCQGDDDDRILLPIPDNRVDILSVSSNSSSAKVYVNRSLARLLTILANGETEIY